MSGRVFVVADLHFGHEKVAVVRGFPDAGAHDRATVEAWNRVVGRRDVVYVLGDVFRLERVQDLLGVKKLALGNHDQRPVREYAALFSKVQGCFDVYGCLLTHVPVHESQLARWPLNVHGHTHARVLKDRRYVCASLEQCPRLEPMPLRELIEERRAYLADKDRERSTAVLEDLFRTKELL